MKKAFENKLLALTGKGNRIFCVKKLPQKSLACIQTQYD